MSGLGPEEGRPGEGPENDEAAAAEAERERLYGLLLFEAEETLARGGAEKAAVLASRAVKERPESLTARSLLDRARRELLRGRRREKLEARVREAEGMLTGGNLQAAERIVTSALKLIPDHPVALELLGKLQALRLASGTAEAEAEKELMRLASSRAKKALEAARQALAAGWEQRALFALRQGLRQAPGDPELLALLREAQKSSEALEKERVRRRALLSQVRDALELQAHQRYEESLKILRAVLLEDPQNTRAQEAVQVVRQALRRGAASAPASTPAVSAPAPTPPARPRDAPLRRAPPVVIGAPSPSPRPAPPAGPRAIPGEILLPRTRRRATPFVAVVGGAAVLGLVLFLVSRASAPGGPPPPPPPPSTARPSSPPPSTIVDEDAGLLAGLDPQLRDTVRATVEAYRRALERADPAALAAARPDLSASQRELLMGPFLQARAVGALNVACDVRILEVTPGPRQVEVQVLRTDVILVEGASARPPVEESLVFEEDRDGTWGLRSRP